MDWNAELSSHRKLYHLGKIRIFNQVGVFPTGRTVPNIFQSALRRK